MHKIFGTIVVELWQGKQVQIGTAGRLYMGGEIDDILPLEGHAAWLAGGNGGTYPAGDFLE